MATTDSNIWKFHQMVLFFLFFAQASAQITNFKPYDVLYVNPNDDHATILRSFANRFYFDHPGRVQPKADEQLLKAWYVLGDPQRKQNYDNNAKVTTFSGYPTYYRHLVEHNFKSLLGKDPERIRQEDVPEWRDLNDPVIGKKLRRQRQYLDAEEAKDEKKEEEQARKMAADKKEQKEFVKNNALLSGEAYVYLQRYNMKTFTKYKILEDRETRDRYWLLLDPTKKGIKSSLRVLRELHPSAYKMYVSVRGLQRMLEASGAQIYVADTDTYIPQQLKKPSSVGDSKREFISMTVKQWYPNGGWERGNIVIAERKYAHLAFRNAIEEEKGVDKKENVLFYVWLVSIVLVLTVGVMIVACSVGFMAGTILFKYRKSRNETNI